MPTDQNIVKVNINDIVPNKNQPRKVFNEESIKELALSIKNYGILNPLLVRKISSGYEIIAGERRYRAAKMLGLTEVPVLVKALSDNEVRELALIENIQRNNLNPIEEAEAFKDILSINNITQEELSRKIGKSQAVISNKMRLLNLSQEVKDAILNGKISEHHGRTLLKLTLEEQNQVLLQIIDKKLSVKATEDLINKKNSKENIKNVLNSIDIDTTNSNTFNDLEKEIIEKGEENMNNNLGIGSFFPQMDNPNSNMNSSLNNNTIMFNNSPVDTSIPNNDTISFNTNTTTVPLNTLNQEPAISTIRGVEPLLNPIPNSFTETPTNNTNVSIEEEKPIEPININLNSKINNPSPSILPEQPLFTPNKSQEIEPNTNNVDVLPQTMLEPPLFANSSTFESVNVEVPTATPNVEINLNTNNTATPEPVITNVEISSIDKVKNVLNSLNDINVSYKEFSNDTENCIIITIKK